ncbi:glycosyltransferase family 2 protein [Paenibacillus athensensis]|nr:glycosyltransferase family 2 protein [Paenibacillus athensensis]MCD1261703.1 glycosyltransferase family 2 protein [Paenibacillus athensensis]
MSMPGVSIVTCTNRPEFLTNLVRNFNSQRYPRKELILIVNNDSANLQAIRQQTAHNPRIRVYRVPERVSLGQCLNCGAAVARYPLIAKFDDDDYYAPAYLREQVRALIRTGSTVVGKHACLVYLAASGRLVIRSPQERNKLLTFVQGGTILFRRSVLKQVRFADISLGEDVRFLRACRRKGHTVYATSPFHYVYMRRKNKSSHTWKAADRFYLQNSVPLAVTRDYRIVASRQARIRHSRPSFF